MHYEVAPKGGVFRPLPVWAGYKDKSLAPVWCWMGAVLLALAWLLPNHAQPWNTFHSEAWMAVGLALVGTVVLYRTRTLTLSSLDLTLLAVAAIPFAQYAIGLVPFTGTAWTSTAYLLGFAVAVVVGRQWHAWRPVHMANMLFGSFFLASIITVGLQLYQWMGLAQERDIFDIWVFGLRQNRPYGNVGQPNLTATLLLWGLVACGWGRQRGYVGPVITAAASSLIVFGIALTQSRSGLLGLCGIILAAWWWRGVWVQRGAAVWSSFLLLVYLSSFVLIRWASTALLLDDPGGIVERTTGEVRPALWALVADAIAHRPWLGYGWNQGLAAHIALAERHPGINSLFAHAHNIFLDFIVWAGVPIGLALTAVCLVWMWQVARRITRPEHALYGLLLLALGLHAMVELPLNYAYFLLPAGLLMGALSGELKVWVLQVPGRLAWRAGSSLFAAATLLLGLVVWDYFKVEESAVAFRMNLARIRSDVPPKAPELAVLTQFEYRLDPFLFDPEIPRSREQLQHARDVTAAVVTYRNLVNLQVLLALNGHAAEARCWMAKSMVLVGRASRPELVLDWQKFQQAYPQLQKVTWPSESEREQACESVKHSSLGPWPQTRW